MKTVSKAGFAMLEKFMVDGSHKPRGRRKVAICKALRIRGLIGIDRAGLYRIRESGLKWYRLKMGKLEAAKVPLQKPKTEDDLIAAALST